MANSSQFGSSIQTTSVWDPSAIPQNLDPVLKEFFIRMYQNLNLMSNVLNVKETGQYTTQFTTLTGMTLSPDPANNSSTQAKAAERAVFRTTIIYNVPLPNTAPSAPIPHGIPFNSGFHIFRYLAACTDPVGLNYIVLPYASPTLNLNIQMDVNANNVIITTGSDRTNFTQNLIFIEYVPF
jgi:hypothetical protein